MLIFVIMMVFIIHTYEGIDREFSVALKKYFENSLKKNTAFLLLHHSNQTDVSYITRMT